MMRIFTIAVLLAAWSSPATAQPKELAKSTITGTVLITAIDYKTRSITLRSSDGTEDTLTAGPEVLRFNELKAGDTIKATYYESWVMEIRKNGIPGSAATVSGNRMAQVPGGTMTAVQSATVTVKAIDPAVPSITVTTADGRTVTRKVADAKKLTGVAVGDHIDISFTQSLMVFAQAAK
jgi:Cu/Ag efflux protein CusF